MPDDAPPPTLGSLPVLEYALVGALAPGADAALRVDGVGVATLGTASRFAICGPHPSGETHLVLCDAEWQPVAVSGHADLAAAKRKAGSLAPSIAWRPSPHDTAAVAAHLADTWDGLVCSFCGRTPLHFDKLVSGPNGVGICNHCVSRLAGIPPRGRS